MTVNSLQDWKMLKIRSAYIILKLNKSIIFKTIKSQFKNEGKLVLISLNPFFDPYKILMVDIGEIPKITNYISSKMPAGKVDKKLLTNASL